MWYLFWFFVFYDACNIALIIRRCWKVLQKLNNFCVLTQRNDVFVPHFHPITNNASLSKLLELLFEFRRGWIKNMFVSKYIDYFLLIDLSQFIISLNYTLPFYKVCYKLHKISKIEGISVEVKFREIYLNFEIQKHAPVVRSEWTRRKFEKQRKFEKPWIVCELLFTFNNFWPLSVSSASKIISKVWMWQWIGRTTWLLFVFKIGT